MVDEFYNRGPEAWFRKIVVQVAMKRFATNNPTHDMKRDDQMRTTKGRGRNGAVRSAMRAPVPYYYTRLLCQ